MQDISLHFSYSAWWVVLFVAIGFGISSFLYWREKFISKKIQRINIALRTIAITLLLMLLIDPYLRFINKEFVPETIVLAVDNSISIPQWDKLDTVAFKQELQNKAQILEEKGYDIRIRAFQGEIALDELFFDAETTDLSALINKSIKETDTRYLTQVMLFSDGIINRGLAPEYSTRFTPVYTIGMGDTLPQIDLSIRTVVHNRLVYLNNKFIAKAEIFQYGFDEKPLTLTLTQGGKELEKKVLRFQKGQNFMEVDFLIDPKEAGLQGYEMQIKGDFPEKNLENNARKFFVEVIENKQKVLIMAASPHPDIKAITASLEKNEGFEIQKAIFGLQEEADINRLLEKEYDLIVLHQFPNANTKMNPYYDKAIKSQAAIFWFPASAGLWSNFSNVNNVVQVQPIRNQSDMVGGVFEKDFNAFSLGDELKIRFDKLNPIQVPFARWSLKAGAEVIIWQKVGSVLTDKPLLILNKQAQKREAVWLGEGLWQWRIQEKSSYENAEAFDQVLSKIAQLIISKDDKRRFKVYPKLQENLLRDGVDFITEMYNELLEPIYGYEVKLSLKSEQGFQQSYTYSHLEGKREFPLSSLPEGVYKYQASTQLEGKNFQSEGSFIIRDLQLEMINLQANHQRLMDISVKSQGEYHHFDQREDLWQTLLDRNPREKIFSYPEERALRDAPWYLLLIMLLFAIEWFLRKYHGVI